MRNLFHFFFPSLLVPVALACASAAPEAAPADAGTHTDAQAPETQAPDAGDPACADYDATVQAGLDAERVRQKLKYATIASWTERCGMHVYVTHDEQSPPITDASFWRIGSVTKTYVAATVLRLLEQGKLSLEDTIDKWFPSFPRSSTITVRHLLNHTSGIFNYTDTKTFRDSITSSPKKVLTPEELIAMASEQEPTGEPGASFSYSNTNYVLLGRIIEAVTGEKAHVVIRREAMDRAGLTQTFLDGQEAVPGDFAKGYANGQDATKVFDLSIAWTAGAMATTPADLLIWLRAMYIDQKVVSASSFTQMTTSVPGAGYGLGVQITDAKSAPVAGRSFGHGGSIFGYQTSALAFPDTKFALVAITGASEGSPNGLVVAALGAFKTLKATP